MSKKEKDKLLAVMENGIKMEGINPILPLSISGILDAKNTLWIMETALIVIVVLNTNGKLARLGKSNRPHSYLWVVIGSAACADPLNAVT